jgi:hypothetical protein
MRLKRYPGRTPPNGGVHQDVSSETDVLTGRLSTGLVRSNTGRVRNEHGDGLHLEPGVSGLELAAALVGWLQRECGATAGEYDVDGALVSIPLKVPARRVASAGTRLRSRITRAHSEELLGQAEDLVRRFEARHRRAHALLVEARELCAPPAPEPG